MTKKFSKILCTILATAMLVSLHISPVAAVDVAFTDVPADSWFANAVTEAVEHGYIKGMGDGRFAPYDDLTYAQVFSMVINAQYENDELSFRTSGDNALTISKAFNGDVPWWGEYAYFLNAKGLLKGTAADNNVTVRGVVESKVTRYAMVQIIYNVLKDKGVSIAQSTIDSAKNSITDWNKVPASFQNAVAAGYGLGIISGFDDHSFGGMGILTRAQSCVIINKTLDVIKSGGTTDPVEPPVEPPVDPPVDPKPGTETNIIVSTKASGNGTAHYVGNNQFPTGTLNNGLPATEENVIALLKKAEGIWPTKTRWTPSGMSDNNWYMENSEIMRQTLSVNHNVNPNYACGGFAAMISDYVFGKSANDTRRVTDMTKIRPGDIIVILNTGNNEKSVNHVVIATSHADASGNVYCAGGNESSIINWPTQWDSASNEKWSTGSWIVYTRYPD